MIDFAVETTLFGPERLSLLLPQDDARVTYLINDYRLEYEFGEYFIIQSEDEVGEDGTAFKKITAEASWMRLADRKRPGGTVIEATPAAGLAENILPGTGWSVFLATSDANTYRLEANDTNVLALIWQWAKLTGNEVEFDSLNHTVSMVPSVGLDLGYSFRYGKNLKSIKRTSVPPKTTRLFPYGKNELDITSVTSGGVPYIENFDYYTDLGMLLADVTAEGSPYIKEEILVDETFTDVNALYDAAVRYLDVVSVEQILYEAKVIDLSTLVGYNEAEFKCGDTVWVQGEPIRVGERARVSRIVKYPYEPDRNQIELSFNPVSLPDAQQSGSRRDTSLEWELFESRNISAKQVRLGTTIVHRIALQMSSGAEYALHYNVEGTGVGNGTLNVQAIDDETGEPLWPAQAFTVANGVRFSWQFSFSDKEVSVGEHVMVIRMWSSGAGVGIDIPAKQTAFWILARGTVRENYTLPNSIRYDFTGAMQNHIVADDTYEILCEVHGSKGGGSGGGLGSLVKAMLPVIAGQSLDIIVGGTTGWPNGGAPGLAGPFSGSPGGGRSEIRPAGTTITSAYLIAGAGGGFGEGSASNPNPFGGIGGFYVGGASQLGNGATQTAGGAGASPGDDGALGQGGNGFSTGNAFNFGGGGGGDGYFGGEGGQAASPPGQSGGGGGSGFAIATAWDIETQDGENDGHGYIIISWENPP